MEVYATDSDDSHPDLLRIPIDRHKLYFGPYRPPQFKYGAKVECEARGQVTIIKLTAARIPWPVGKTHRATSLVLYEDLARAVKREAACAVRHWWGVGTVTVSKWRRSLGVPPMNEGDRRLKSEHAKGSAGKAARTVAVTKARDPERRAKIAAAKRGKPRPPHVHEALLRANLGRKLSRAHRNKLSEAHRRKNTMPPAAGRSWAKWEDELLKRLSPEEAAGKTGRTIAAVFARRHKLKLPDRRRARDPAS